MDERIRAELDQLSPNVPFRASAAHKHRTWAGTFHSRPELYIRPQSLEEIQKVVTLAGRCKRRIVVVGCGHSPSDLTCTSSWMVNLDEYNRVLDVDYARKRMTVEGGIRLRDVNRSAADHGLTIPNLGSIDEQSIVGAFSTGTHGSSLRHGLISEKVKSLRIVLANGQAEQCSESDNPDLFRAALLSLGALGIIVEVELEMVDSANIEWAQTLKPLDYVLSNWDKDLWTDKEFTRVWWLPYMKRAIIWSASRTNKPERPPQAGWYGGAVGFHTYHILLWLSNKIPAILPAVEWFVFGMQYGFSCDSVTTAIEPQRSGLLMNCLYSQFVNEWAVPLEKGPEIISRLSAWLNGDPNTGIPFSARGLYVHCPIEVRVSDSTCRGTVRPWLDNTADTGPTLYLNATLYRPYLQDPPCRARYYEAFEWLMQQYGGKPHWAKNFSYVSKGDVARMYGDNLTAFLRVRDAVDPQGVFVGAWQRKYLVPDATPLYACEEEEVGRQLARDGGQNWFGEVASERRDGGAGKGGVVFEDGDEDVPKDYVEGARTHGRPRESVTGLQVFDKM